MGEKNLMWACFAQLGTNMWNEEGNTLGREHRSTCCASSVLRFERDTWDDYMRYQKKCGVNTVVIDLGEAMRFDSHPELAVEGSFTKDEMRAEIKRLNEMGFVVIPKLNFSATHDIWLKDYSRMLSTPIYYQVCEDIIKETCEVFKPKFFHIGMDEENADLQRNFYFCAVRQRDLWWHDLYFLVNCVEKQNVRAWVWSDYMWHHCEEYISKMPKSVLQSNWHYNNDFGCANEEHSFRIKCFDLLDKHGFDQVPTGSNWAAKENFLSLTKYCAESLSDEHLYGFMQTVWDRIAKPWMPKQYEAADCILQAKRWYEEYKK